MNMIVSTLSSFGRLVLRNPTQTSGLAVFALGFCLVAGNAVLMQPEKHSAPFWETSGLLNSTPKNADRAKRTDITSPVIAHEVITQSISLRNIPIPTSNPVKSKKIAAHSSLVRDIQSLLSEAGLYNGKVDGIFGDATRKAILDYQETAGIIPDGIASFGLLANLKSALAVAKVKTGEPQLTATSSHAGPELIVLDAGLVQKVQTGLRDFYAEDDITVDGIFGNQTRNALRKFQKRFKISVSGELDQETLKKLREAGIVDAT